MNEKQRENHISKSNWTIEITRETCIGTTATESS